MSFKKDQKVVCVDAKGNSQVANGDVLTVVRDQGEGSLVSLRNSEGREVDFYAYRFQLVPQFPTLTAGQRVTMSGGDVGIVVANADKGLAIKLKESTWTAIEFDNKGEHYADWNVVAVYAAPIASQAFNFDKKGELVWDKDGTAEKIAAAKAKLVAASEAAQAAEKALAEADAELAALTK